MARELSRREVLKRSAAGAVAAVALPVRAQRDDEPYSHLSADEARTLEAMTARLIPSDENGPGALEAGAARYIDRGLGGALGDSLAVYRQGLAAVEAAAQATAGRPFAALEPGVQDALLERLERGDLAGFSADPAAFFELVLNHTIQGTFCDPAYGGNRDFIGWEMLGYPGIRLSVTPAEQRFNAELEMSRLSAYDLPMFDRDASLGDGDGD